MVTAVRDTVQHEGVDVAYYLTRHLITMKWKDGNLVFCKRCDQETPMAAVSTPKGVMLRCGQGHDTHPINVVVSKGLE